MQFRLAALAVLVPLILAAQNLKDFEKKVTEFTLPNGLHFIVVERHEAPAVSFHTRVNAGSVNDPAGQAGMARMLERMAFKGTESVGSVDWPSEKKALDAIEEIYDRIDAERNRGPLASEGKIGGIETQLRMAIDSAQAFAAPNPYWGIIEANGGVALKAAASPDATEYSCSLPSNRIELWFLMESQRFLNPVFRDFYKERSALMEENRARLETDAQAHLLQELLSTAFEAHPYRNPSGGWPGDLAALRASEARRFFQEYFVAANVSITLAGDINPAEARRLADRYFGPMPARPLPPAVHTSEPPQPGPKTAAVIGAGQPMAFIGYKRPDQYDPDSAVYDVMQLLLSEGPSGLLYKNLVEGSRISLAAQSVSAVPAARYPGLFAFFLVPSPGHTVEENEKALNDLLARIQQDGVAEAALARAKTQAHAAVVRRLATNAGLAALFTTFHANFGDWRRLFTSLDDIDKVTLLDIQRTAQRCFVPVNRTLAYAVAGQPRGDRQ
ncbi:MAG TPA: pitrilysin family protein [Bryobacteraceae bacterium]|nr:pitrilysin family protein [Bryobacteraceae bacterium]